MTGGRSSIAVGAPVGLTASRIMDQATTRFTRGRARHRSGARKSWRRGAPSCSWESNSVARGEERARPMMEGA